MDAVCDNASKAQWPGNEDWPKMDEEACRQRGERGWANSDTYSFDHYLAGVIAAGVREIAEFPGWHGESREEWLSMLTEMAEGFEAYNVPANFCDDATYQRVRHSLKLLRRYFGALWT